MLASQISQLVNSDKSINVMYNISINMISYDLSSQHEKFYESLIFIMFTLLSEPPSTHGSNHCCVSLRSAPTTTFRAPPRSRKANEFPPQLNQPQIRCTQISLCPFEAFVTVDLVWPPRSAIAHLPPLVRFYRILPFSPLYACYS